MSVLFLAARADADLLVDHSPDGTGVGAGASYYNTMSGFNQNIGDQFTLNESVMITSASLYSISGYASVGDTVRFLIFNDLGGTPAPVPLVDMLTTIDLIDSEGTTTQPSLQRQRASVPNVILNPGTYFFSMPGISADHVVTLGGYDDDAVWAGFDGNPDLEVGPFNGVGGDMFMRFEGQTIPEPVGTALIGIFALACLRRVRRATV